MSIALRMVSRRWLLTTLLVIAAMGVMARLGVWQLDRLEKRRAFNSRVLAQTSQPALVLDSQSLGADIANMEYREIIATGEYDHTQEIALRNQSWNNLYGVHLVTPLKISGMDQAILVDRGWIPAADFESGDWSKYVEPGIVEVRGVVRASQNKADFGKRSDPIPAAGEPALMAWNFVNIAGIQNQVSLPLQPAYIQQAPADGWEGPPYRSQPKLELSEGPHMSYAIQWFSFAALLGVGYPFFIRRQEQRNHADEKSAGETERRQQDIHSVIQ